MQAVHLPRSPHVWPGADQQQQAWSSALYQLQCHAQEERLRANQAYEAMRQQHVVDTARIAALEHELAQQQQARAEATTASEVQFQSAMAVADAAKARATALQIELEGMQLSAVREAKPQTAKLLRNIAALQAQLKRTRITSAAHSQKRRDLHTSLAAAKRKLKSEVSQRIQLSGPSSRALQKLLTMASADLPPAQQHLRALVEDQLKCLRNNSGWCHWSPTMIDLCNRVRRASGAAYEVLREFGVLTLPSANHLRKVSAAVGETTGHDPKRYESIRDALDQLGLCAPHQREVVLLFDEINVVGDIAFKLVNGKYELHGLMDEEEGSHVFQPPPAASNDGASVLKDKVATHALVFQTCVLHHDAVEAGGGFVRHIVGVHATHNAGAEEVDALFWDTIAHLKEIASVRVAASVCDGAGPNRLMQKWNCSAQGRGTPNTFVRAWCPNDIEHGEDAKIFLISDISHLLKKVVNNLEKSTAKVRLYATRARVIGDAICKFPEHVHEKLRGVHA